MTVQSDAFVLDEAGVLCRYEGRAATAEVPAGVVGVREEAFAGAAACLAEVRLPEGVTWIGEGAFLGCAGLKRVKLPGTLRRLGSSAFFGCAALTEIALPPGLPEIEDWTFAKCAGLTCVDLPQSLRRIGAHAFEDCVALLGLCLPQTCEEIGEAAFSGCAALGAVRLPGALRILGEGAFPEKTKVSREEAALPPAKGEADLVNMYVILRLEEKMGRTGRSAASFQRKYGGLFPAFAGGEVQLLREEMQRAMADADVSAYCDAAFRCRPLPERFWLSTHILLRAARMEDVEEKCALVVDLTREWYRAEEMPELQRLTREAAQW